MNERNRQSADRPAAPPARIALSAASALYTEFDAEENRQAKPGKASSTLDLPAQSGYFRLTSEQQGMGDKMFRFGSAVLLMAIGSGLLAQAQVPKITKFDPAEELKLQIERVQEGRKTVMRDYNSPSDIAGVVFACDVVNEGTGEVKLKGTPYPTKLPSKLIVDGLSRPQARQFVLEVGGSVASPFVQLAQNKKHLISSQVFENVRIETERVLDPKLQKDIESTLRIAGHQTGESYCYVYSVSSYIAEIRIDRHQKVETGISGVFTLTGEGSYLRSETYLDRRPFATLVASRYEIQPEVMETRPAAPAQPEVRVATGEVRAPSEALLDLGARALNETSRERERAELYESLSGLESMTGADDPRSPADFEPLSDADLQSLIENNDMSWQGE